MKTALFRSPSRLACLLFGVMCTGLVSCPSSKRERPNILWIVVDTMRADRLGGPKDLTPYMDQLAEGGVVFESAYAQAPWTLPSIGSMMTSMHPKEHGAGVGNIKSGFHRVRDGVATAPSVMKRAGYQTHAIVNVEFLDPSFGVTRDFDNVDLVSYSNNVEVRNAEVTTSAALEYMEGAIEKEGPFFLLLHYFDMHAVFDPPQPFRKRYAAPQDREGGPNRTLMGTRAELMALREGTWAPSAEWIRRAELLYDGEVAYTDAEIGRLLDGLAALGLRENTLIVLCGDHGEEFHDHGGFEHGHTVYEELIHVPLVMAGPGIKAGGQIAERVRMIDILPTLCEWADVGAERSFVGLSLMGFLRGEGGKTRKVMSHGNMWGPAYTAWIDQDWKLIVGGDGTKELYHLGQDPLEEDDQANQKEDRLGDLVKDLQGAEAAMSRLGPGSKVELTDAQAESIKASGYGGGD